MNEVISQAKVFTSAPVPHSQLPSLPRVRLAPGSEHTCPSSPMCGLTLRQPPTCIWESHQRAAAGLANSWDLLQEHPGGSARESRRQEGESVETSPSWGWSCGEFGTLPWCMCIQGAFLNHCHLPGKPAAHTSRPLLTSCSDL